MLLAAERYHPRNVIRQPSLGLTETASYTVNFKVFVGEVPYVVHTGPRRTSFAYFPPCSPFPIWILRLYSPSVSVAKL